MEISGINWLTELSQNASLTLGASGVNDPMPGGFYRNDMVNLQTILYAFVHSPHIVDAVSFGLVMIAVAWLAMLVISAPRADRNLPLLCLTITLSVLPVYHRLYDVLPLALLLIWSIRRLHTRLRPHAITTLVLLCEFLIPIDFIPTMVRWLHLPQGMTETVWWQGIIVPHHAWGMVLLTGWLLYLCTALAPRAQSAALQSHRREWHGWARLSHR